MLLPLAVWFITKTQNKKKQKPPNKKKQTTKGHETELLAQQGAFQGELNSLFLSIGVHSGKEVKRSPTDIAPSVLLPLAVWFITKTPNKKKQKPPSKKK